MTIRDPRAVALADSLIRRGVRGDARGEFLRLCPDVLTTSSELQIAAQRVGEAMAALR